MANYRKDYDGELLKVFNIIYKEYLFNNRGYLNILDYLKGRYDFNPQKWKKIARKAGVNVIERDGVFYIKA